MGPIIIKDSLLYALRNEILKESQINIKYLFKYLKHASKKSIRYKNGIKFTNNEIIWMFKIKYELIKLYNEFYP